MTKNVLKVTKKEIEAEIQIMRNKRFRIFSRHPVTKKPLNPFKSDGYDTKIDAIKMSKYYNWIYSGTSDTWNKRFAVIDINKSKEAKRLMKKGFLI